MPTDHHQREDRAMGDLKGPAPEGVTFSNVTHFFGDKAPGWAGSCIGGYIDPESVKGPSLASKDWPFCHGDKPENFDAAPAQIGQIVVEVDLGPDDVLLLTCEQALRYGVAERYAAELRAVLEKPGRQAIVIDAGMVPMVLHRTIPAEDKARSKAAKPYLEERPAPVDAGPRRAAQDDLMVKEWPGAIPEGERYMPAEGEHDVSRGTSEGSDP